jgi:hypothetical protein
MGTSWTRWMVHWPSIDVTRCTFPKQEMKGWYKQFPPPTEVPQPAGPFFQVGGKQMLALKQLTAIFEGALPSRKKDATSPLIEINDNDAPPRV